MTRVVPALLTRMSRRPCFRDDRGHQSPGRLGSGHVGLAIGTTDLGRHRLTAYDRGARVDDHVRPGTGKRSGGRGANAAARPGDQGHLAVQRTHQDLEVVAVDVRVSGPEAQAHVKAIGRVAGRIGGQVDGACPGGCGHLQRRPVQGVTASLAPGLLRHHDVLDPTPHPGRDAQDDERQHADDLAAITVPGQQQPDGWRVDDLRHCHRGRRRRRPGQLGQQSGHGIDHFRRCLGRLGNDHHTGGL